MVKILAALALATLYAPLAHAQAADQDFELGQGNWYADNGVWEVGAPTLGPPSCHQGAGCAGTVLSAQYPFTISRLVSPPVQLDSGSAQNPLSLRFWHWFQWGGATGGNPDQGVVQISVYDAMLDTWSMWTNVGTVFSGSSGTWTLNIIDLTAFSNSVVRIGFSHQGSHAFSTGAGWFVDEVEIPGTALIAGFFADWQDFELGQGNWSADNGIWEVGTPTAGPPACYQGTGCVATLLSAQYPFNNSRLISPPVQLRTGTFADPLLLRFWHWFQWGGPTGGNPDQGVVQISVYDAMLDTWSPWADVSTVFSSSSGAWTLNIVDLTAFSNELVKIGFFHQGSHAFSTGAGWFVDGIGLTGFTGVYVLDTFGALHGAGGGGVPLPPAPPYFGFDIARDTELTVDGAYVLDGFGGIHTAGGAQPLGPPTPYFGFDIAQDLELAAGGGAYTLDGFGGGHPFGGGALVDPVTPFFGFDIARDLELGGGGYYVLDGWGGLHVGGGATPISPALPYFGFDIARDLELAAGGGAYALDGFGGVHALGGAPLLNPTTPYFGFDIGRDMELDPGGNGFYVLDGFGGVHTGGGATPPTGPAPYFGFDAARDLEIR